MTRLLAPDAFGIVALATFFFSVLQLRTKVDVARAFVQLPASGGTAVGTMVALDLAAALLTVLLTAIAALVVPLAGYPPEVGVAVTALGGIGVVEAAGSLPTVLLDKRLRFGRASLMTAIALPISYLPAFAAAWLGAGYWSLILQLAVQAGIYSAGLFWIGREAIAESWREGWALSRAMASRLVSFGVAWGVGGLAVLLTSQLDTFLVGTVVGLEELGFYDRAYRIALWPSILVTGIVSRTSYVAYARLQGEPERLARAATLTLWFISRASLPIGLALLAAAPSLVEVLYGPRWLPAAPFLRLLVAVSLLRPLIEDLVVLLGAVGRPRLAALTNWSGALALLLLGPPLTLAAGGVGTAAAVGLAYAVAALVAARLVRQVVRLPAGELVGAPAAALLAGGALAIVVSVVAAEAGLPLRLALEVIPPLAAFAAVLWLLERERLGERVRSAVRLARSGDA